MRRFLYAFLTLFFVFASSETDALIFGEDHRLTVSTEAGSLFGPVGMVPAQEMANMRPPS